MSNDLGYSAFEGDKAMSEKDRSVSSRETRRFLDNAMREFRTTADPDSRLRSLWKISQLVESTTDEELYELASATAVAEDHRLRAEICYTISRSRRPQLMKILREMIRDRNPYVRRSAITALGELGGNPAILIAMESILDEMDKLRSAVTSLEEKTLHLDSKIEEAIDANTPSSPAHETIMDDQMECWETYLRHEGELLRDHKGKYVAIYGKEIVAIGEDKERLAEMIYEKHGSVEALICRIEEEGKPIQMPPPRNIVDP
jgi:CRISPR/Cas system CSM-associated protein Csm2 small subunit